MAKFENIYEDLIASQNQIPKELEKLRNEGKTKSVRFRELMVNKMTNANIIELFKTMVCDNILTFAKTALTAKEL